MFWGFWFWNVNRTLITTPNAELPAPRHDYTASAWYFPGPRLFEKSVFTSAFSLDKNQVVAGQTPIASVSVAGAWPGPPSTTVATDKSNGPVTIDAVNHIVGAGRFVSWAPLGKATVAGHALTAPADSDILAIAFYA